MTYPSCAKRVHKSCQKRAIFFECYIFPGFLPFCKYMCWKYSIYKHKKICIIKTNIEKTVNASMEVLALDTNAMDKRECRMCVCFYLFFNAYRFI